MSEPLIVLVLLASGARDPADEKLVASARDVLGRDAIVLVEAGSDGRDDASALALGARVQARAVVRVVWTEERAAARLDVHVEPSTEWAHDEIRFRASDAPAERARTVGFAVASMVQRLDAASEAPLASAPPPPPTPVERRVEGAEPAPSPRRTTSDVDAFAEGAAAFGGAATGFGAVAGVRWFFGSRVGVRGAAGARFGSIDAASASARMLVGGAGVVVRMARVGAVLLDARTDALALHQEVSRSYPTGDVTRSRWLAGADVAAEASWPLSARFAITASAGAEAAFGTTDVDVGGEARARIPALRALTEIGVRVGF